MFASSLGRHRGGGFCYRAEWRFCCDFREPEAIAPDGANGGTRFLSLRLATKPAELGEAAAADPSTLDALLVVFSAIPSADCFSVRRKFLSTSAATCTPS